MTWRALIPVLVLTAVAAGCTAGSSTSPPLPTLSPNPTRSQLLARAALRPCPPSESVPAPDGLPNVTLPCLGAGPAVHLAGLRGIPTVVNIWGSWCAPCRKEMPYFATAARALGNRVRFLGVDTLDTPDSPLDFVAHVRPRLHYPSVFDEDKKVLLGLHGPIAVPSTFYVDAAGRLVGRHFGEYTSLTGLRSDIARYLGVRR